jgi:hypothetical protein
LEIEGGALDVDAVAGAGFLNLGVDLVQPGLIQFYDGTEAVAETPARQFEGPVGVLQQPRRPGRAASGQG